MARHLKQPKTGVSRRALLAAGLATAVATAGCSTSGSSPPKTAKASTYAELVATNPFFVAHRGGGRNWPEMTAFAYDQAVALPYVKAIEVSVSISSDGVLVCSHDANTLRMTGVNHEIEKTAWATLSRLLVSARETDDPSQPARPFTKFEDVVGHLRNVVFFVEPKTRRAVDALFERMVAARQPERVVWKQPVNSARFAQAKEAGFHTWGYGFDVAYQYDQLPKYASSPDIDLLGVGIAQSDRLLREVVQAANENGKRVMTWPIVTPANKARALKLGIVGLMTSDILHVPGS